MITNNQNYSPLHTDTAGSPYDKASEAVDMVRGILATLRCAVNPDTDSPQVYAGQLLGAIEAALFLAEKAQDQIDLLHEQLLSPSNEVAHEDIS